MKLKHLLAWSIHKAIKTLIMNQQVVMVVVVFCFKYTAVSIVLPTIKMKKHNLDYS